MHNDFSGSPHTQMRAHHRLVTVMIPILCSYELTAKVAKQCCSGFMSDKSEPVTDRNIIPLLMLFN